MITFDEAVKKANEYLSNTEISVVITSQGRFSEGWFFCFQSREYIEHGDPSAQLAGNAPFIIDKENGELHVLGTAQPLMAYLQEYEEMKNNMN
ncbi:YrhB family protein [Serratia fonticola]|uniref:YrhB domain-containing protein n=1 Tax=Serratia fonticola TaxID=47917 RepID=UPI002096FE14|nr:YrhB domain-containing protein [Serratia fonticola]MCO7511470.1 YrhB family protein [Serratia fonticola]